MGWALCSHGPNKAASKLSRTSPEVMSMRPACVYRPAKPHATDGASQPWRSGSNRDTKKTSCGRQRMSLQRCFFPKARTDASAYSCQIGQLGRASRALGHNWRSYRIRMAKAKRRPRSCSSDRASSPQWAMPANCGWK
eukprot:scaffold12086_cov67-Phaeocystis_antarctica.AAC.15